MPTPLVSFIQPPLEIMPTLHHWCLTSSHLLFLEIIFWWIMPTFYNSDFIGVLHPATFSVLEIMPTLHHWCLSSSHFTSLVFFGDNADFTSLVSFIQPLLFLEIMPTFIGVLHPASQFFGIMPTLHHWCLSSSHL